MIDATIVRAHQHSAGSRKKRCVSHRPVPRRGEHHNSRAHRRARQSVRLDADSWARPRSCLRWTIAGKYPPRRGHRRYGLRRGCPHRQTHGQGAIPVIRPKANRKYQRECDFVLYCERNLIERFLTRLSTSTALRRDMISSRETILPRFCWSPQSSSTAKLRTESFLEEFRPCDLRTNPHHSAAGLPSIGVFVLVASRGGVSHCGHCQHNPSGHTDHEGEHDVHHFHS